MAANQWTYLLILLAHLQAGTSVDAAAAGHFHGPASSVAAAFLPPAALAKVAPQQQTQEATQACSSLLQAQSSASSPSSQRDVQTTVTMTTLDVREEAERKEMSWLVKSTARLLGGGGGCGNNNSGKRGRSDWLTKGDMRRMKPVMRAWARRASKRRRHAIQILPDASTSQPVGDGSTSSTSSTSNHSAKVVEQLFQRIKREESEGNPNACVQVEHCNFVIEAYCRQGNREAILQAEDWMLGNYSENSEEEDSGSSSVRLVNSHSVNMIIKAWLKLAAASGNENNRESDELRHAEEMLTKAEELGIATIRGYNLYLTAMQRLSLPREAESILKRMRNQGLEPNVHSYCICILTNAKVGGKKSLETAERLFQELKDANFVPRVNVFNAMINCYNRGGSSSSLVLRNVRKLLDEMDEAGTVPNLITVNTILTICAKVKTITAVRFAEELFRKAERTYGLDLDTLSFNLMIKMHSEFGDVEKNIVLLDQMEKSFRMTQFGARQATPMPDALTYVSVINSIACSNVRGRGNKAEDMLHRMDTLHRNALGAKPTSEVYDAVLNTWAVSGDRFSVKSAKNLFERMEERYNEGDESLKPTRKTYNTMLKVYTSSGHGEAAERLLNRMEQASKDGRTDLAPDGYSFSTVINAYAKSRTTTGKAEHAIRLLNRMIESYANGNVRAQPTIQAFNACLNACAYTSSADEKIEAFLIAVSCFLMMENHETNPDHVTYATFLKGVSKLIPKGEERRRQVVDVVWHRCRRDGLVSPFVMNQMAFAATPDQYQQLIKEGFKGNLLGKTAKWEDIPREWRRNV